MSIATRAPLNFLKYCKKITIFKKILFELDLLCLNLHNLRVRLEK